MNWSLISESDKFQLSLNVSVTNTTFPLPIKFIIYDIGPLFFYHFYVKFLHTKILYQNLMFVGPCILVTTEE